MAYALPGRAIVQMYRLTDPATVADALGAAAADPAFAGLDLHGCPVGVYGQLARPAQRLEAGDRVEIYRPLGVDPKTARRARVRQGARGR